MGKCGQHDDWRKLNTTCDIDRWCWHTYSSWYGWRLTCMSQYFVLLTCSVHGVGGGQHDGAGVCVAHTTQPARLHCVRRFQTLHQPGRQTQPSKSPHHVSSTSNHSYFTSLRCVPELFKSQTINNLYPWRELPWVSNHQTTRNMFVAGHIDASKVISGAVQIPYNKQLG